MLTWKTDWNAEDNHARNGAQDLERLIGNYESTRINLAALFGVAVSFASISINGRYTYPFASLLNAIEQNMNALHVWPVSSWVSKVISWLPGEKAPTYEDVNRWEQNGQCIERTALTSEDDFLYCGTFTADTSKDGQHFDDLFDEDTAMYFITSEGLDFYTANNEQFIVG